MPSLPRVVQSLPLAAILHAQATPQPCEAIGPLATGVIARSSAEAEPWALRPIVLLSLGSDWQPRIASVGGGAAVTMTMERRPEATPAAGREREAKASPAPATDASTRQIVEHILPLPFGASFRPQLESFVRTFFEYRDAGLFR